MKTILVWAILSAAACIGKCAVDFQPASFVRSRALIGEYLHASAFADRLVAPFVVEIFPRDGLRIAGVDQGNERYTAYRTLGGLFEQSRHAPTVADQHDPRNHPPRSGISRAEGQHVCNS